MCGQFTQIRLQDEVTKKKRQNVETISKKAYCLLLVVVKLLILDPCKHPTTNCVLLVG